MSSVVIQKAVQNFPVCGYKYRGMPGQYGSWAGMIAPIWAGVGGRKRFITNDFFFFHKLASFLVSEARLNRLIVQSS